MKSSMALAAGLAAVLVAVISLPAPAAFAATINVDIVPGASTKSTDAFSPSPAEVNVGDTVVWTNKDSALHTVTSGNPTDGADGMFGGTADSPKLIAPNKTQEFTFDTAGEYDYYCTLHPAMVGKVIVAAGGGGGEPKESSAEVELDNNTYTVTAKSADNAVVFADIFPGESVQVEFDGPGEVELTLQKSMIDGISTVNAGGEDIQFETVNSTADTTTIKFMVPEGGETVEITGATVVPEFGVIAALVLAVSLVAVIGVARFKGNFFGLGRF